MKRIKQWFIGLIFSLCGTSIILCFVGTVVNFIGMMNSIGKEFVGHFISFVLFLIISIFMPYIYFKGIQDGVKEKFK